MRIQRHFLGWDGPIVEKVSRWLLEGKAGPGPMDFHDTLIVVPTLQAGRRLRETLAQRCHERGSVMLSAMIVTPYYVLAGSRPGLKVAPPAVVRATWTHILETADLSRFGVLFPCPQSTDPADRFPWALAHGDMLERLRKELADGGYRIPDVVVKHAGQLEELDRWKDLAALEKLYVQKLGELGFADPCLAKISLADQPELDPDITRIVVAGVPDPALLALRALGNLARERSVEILIHAPASMSNTFDDWGRPIPDAWAKESVELPGWDSNVFLEASPDTQGRRVVEIVSGLPRDYGPADIGIGVPDPAVIPFLEKELRAIGLPAFNPADAPFRDHSLGRLVDALSSLLTTRAYIHLADLLRHPDVIHYLKASHTIESEALLTQLDTFQNRVLPDTLDSMLAHVHELEKDGGAGSARRFPALGKALQIIREHVDVFDSRPPEEAWRAFLQSVYEVRKIDPDVKEDREFQQASEVVEQTFRELRDVPAADLSLDNRRLMAVFVQRLREQVYHRERADAVLDMQGWLELPWTDTPALIVTGVNEAFVPGGSMSDLFLPDSLRTVLTLRDDRSRFGRDVYLLKCLVESRRQGGRLCVIAGKYTLSGDPLRPSRLLFQCRADELPARARQLFMPIEQADRVSATETIFRLKPAAAERDTTLLDDKIISVTALADYLACPFRFYLKHILKMESLSDDKHELDALDFGSLVHQALQGMGEDRDLWACPDPIRLGKCLVDLVNRAATERYGKTLPSAALVALSSAWARLEALARVQVELAGQGWEIIAVEQKKTLQRQGFTLTGKIDRIDRQKDSGLIRIIDYKTSDTDKSPAAQHLVPRREGAADYNRWVFKGKKDRTGKAREKEMQWRNLQLPLYCLLYDEQRAFDSGHEPAYVNLPKAVSETGLSPWKDFGNDGMVSAVRCMDGVLAGIADRTFWPPAASVEHDEDFAMLFLGAPETMVDITGFAP